VIARLQQFYGGDPAGWLRLPVALVRSYLANLPKLQAEQLLLATQVTMIGTGSMKKNVADRQLAGWRRLIGGAQAVRPTTQEQRTALARAAGIGVRDG
jgi:hypothetical protein